MTRLWSKPGWEVLAVPGTSSSTSPSTAGRRRSNTVPRTGATSPVGISSSVTGVYQVAQVLGRWWM